jgi:hypothetical protein
MKANGGSLFYKRISDLAKIQTLRERIASRREQKILNSPRVGVRNVICEAPCDNHFAELYFALLKSPRFISGHGPAQYKYDDIDGNVHLISGVDVVSELFRDIVSKDSQLFLLREKIQSNLQLLQSKYNRTRNVGNDGVVRISIGWLFHEIVLHATFSQFLFPLKTQGLPAQMSDHVKYFAKGVGRQIDPAYGEYLSENMSWYFKLKSLRDAVTHFGGLMLVLEETDNRKMWMYFYPRRAHVLENRVSFEGIEYIVNGYYKYKDFYRNHFLKELSGADKGRW